MAVALIEEALASLPAGRKPPAAVEVCTQSPDLAEVVLIGGDGTRQVLRAFTDRRRYRRELNPMVALGTSGMVPLLTFYDWHRQDPPFVLVYVEPAGRPLAQTDPDERWEQVAVRLWSVHSKDLAPDEFPLLTDGGDGWWGSRLTELAADAADLVDSAHLTTSAASRLRANAAVAFADLDEPRLRAIHGDLDPAKVICRPGVRPVTFCDLASAGWGDAAWDLVTLCVDDPGKLPVLLRRYPDAEVVERVAVVERGYWIAHHLALARRAIDRGGDPQAHLPALTELA